MICTPALYCATLLWWPVQLSDERRGELRLATGTGHSQHDIKINLFIWFSLIYWPIGDPNRLPSIIIFYQFNLLGWVNFMAAGWTHFGWAGCCPLVFFTHLRHLTSLMLLMLCRSGIFFFQSSVKVAKNLPPEFHLGFYNFVCHWPSVHPGKGKVNLSLLSLPQRWQQ